MFTCLHKTIVFFNDLKNVICDYGSPTSSKWHCPCPWHGENWRPSLKLSHNELENQPFYSWVNPLFRLGPFSIAMLNYQRVYPYLFPLLITRPIDILTTINGYLPMNIKWWFSNSYVKLPEGISIFIPLINH